MAITNSDLFIHIKKHLCIFQSKVAEEIYFKLDGRTIKLQKFYYICKVIAPLLKKKVLYNDTGRA